MAKRKAYTGARPSSKKSASRGGGVSAKIAAGGGFSRVAAVEKHKKKLEKNFIRLGGIIEHRGSDLHVVEE